MLKKSRHYIQIDRKEKRSLCETSSQVHRCSTSFLRVWSLLCVCRCSCLRTGGRIKPHKSRPLPSLIDNSSTSIGQNEHATTGDRFRKSRFSAASWRGGGGHARGSEGNQRPQRVSSRKQPPDQLKSLKSGGAHQPTRCPRQRRISTGSIGACWLHRPPPKLDDSTLPPLFDCGVLTPDTPRNKISDNPSPPHQRGS